MDNKDDFIHNDDFYKIIAIRFGSKIIFGQAALDRLNQGEAYDQLMSLAEFKMLSRLDLGDKWGQYAEHAPVLFELKRETSMDVRQPTMMMHRMI